MSPHLFVASSLEALLKMPLIARDDLQLWLAEAQKFQDQIASLGVELPEDVWHFLADADIRSRPTEGAYRVRQEAAVRRFITELHEDGHAS
jgi:hypothetical protein